MGIRITSCYLCVVMGCFVYEVCKSGWSRCSCGALGTSIYYKDTWWCRKLDLMTQDVPSSPILLYFASLAYGYSCYWFAYEELFFPTSCPLEPLESSTWFTDSSLMSLGMPSSILADIPHPFASMIVSAGKICTRWMWWHFANTEWPWAVTWQLREAEIQPCFGNSWSCFAVRMGYVSALQGAVIEMYQSFWVPLILLWRACSEGP